MYPDVGFGFTWYMNPSKDKSKINAYLGISGFHLNQPNISLVGADSKLPIKMSYIGGIKIFESDKIEITPNAMVTTQAGNVETALGTYVDYIFAEGTKLTIGLWYRRNDAIAILVGFEYKGFSLGYSYDAVTSTITSNISTGLNANEITLTYRLNRRKAGTKTSAQFNTNSGSDLNKGSSSSSGGGDAGNPSPFPHF
jgi:type IX secretion system PorP/SprF family membrane protein